MVIEEVFFNETRSPKIIPITDITCLTHRYSFSLRFSHKSKTFCKSFLSVMVLLFFNISQLHSSCKGYFFVTRLTLSTISEMVKNSLLFLFCVSQLKTIRGTSVVEVEVIVDNAKIWFRFNELYRSLTKFDYFYEKVK